MEKVKIILSPKTPFQRGARDSYYRAGFKPHYISGNQRIEITDPKSDLWKAYEEGYNENEKDGIFKEWD